MRRLAAALVVGTSGFVALHELGRRWGATREEFRAPMAGDDIVAHAKGQTTHAITIRASAEDVWPWLVQMGYHRAGWYTYPWVDRYLWHIENPSAADVIPELRHLSVGDIVPDGEPGTAFYRVIVLEPSRTLVLGPLEPPTGQQTSFWGASHARRRDARFSEYAPDLLWEVPPLTCGRSSGNAGEPCGQGGSENTPPPTQPTNHRPRGVLIRWRPRHLRIKHRRPI